VGATPELSPDKQFSTTSLNTIVACNLHTGFKVEFYKRMRHTEAMPTQVKYIKSQKHFNKTSCYDTREPNPLKLYANTF